MGDHTQYDYDVFALSFVLDFFIFADFRKTVVEAVYSKLELTMRLSDTNIRLVETPLLTFQTEYHPNFIQKADSLFVKKSLFYNNYNYTSNRDPNLVVRIQNFAYPYYLFVIITFLAGNRSIPQLKSRKENSMLLSSAASSLLYFSLLLFFT